MGKLASLFDEIKYKNFATLDGMVADVMQEVRENNSISIIVAANEFQKYLSVFTQVEEINTFDIERSNNNKEYWISFYKDDKGVISFYASTMWSDKENRYYPVFEDDDSIFLVSYDASARLCREIHEKTNKIITYEIKE